jgi:hypothetical protein
MTRWNERDETESFDDVLIKAETDKACLCLFDDGVEHWIPKSQIHADSEVWQDGDEGVLVLTRWIAEQKGLA